MLDPVDEPGVVLGEAGRRLHAGLDHGVAQAHGREGRVVFGRLHLGDLPRPAVLHLAALVPLRPRDPVLGLAAYRLQGLEALLGVGDVHGEAALARLAYALRDLALPLRPPVPRAVGDRVLLPHLAALDGVVSCVCDEVAVLLGGQFLDVPAIHADVAHLRLLGEYVAAEPDLHHVGEVPADAVVAGAVRGAAPSAAGELRDPPEFDETLRDGRVEGRVVGEQDASLQSVPPVEQLGPSDVELHATPVPADGGGDVGAVDRDEIRVEPAVVAVFPDRHVRQGILAFPVVRLVVHRHDVMVRSGLLTLARIASLHRVFHLILP